jgi:hypothetical protein
VPFEIKNSIEKLFSYVTIKNKKKYASDCSSSTSKDYESKCSLFKLEETRTTIVDTGSDS